ncbi:hypothetical protein [Wenjunlia tyrosinilytica]|uniref:Uncharacterized protein n=1 Tax=Wenjunlia tyrosinilytica TaxID=1544741 RepID=A0A917ZXQ2_9ACTN|nr:hypothetical protein [Wenjunlia tyrosinilytica]GGO98775.1 hypothetical protein GCM10012280_63700 [Wenjunlia tyrosinilytica]
MLRRDWRDEPRLIVLTLLFVVLVLFNVAVFFGSHPGIHMTVRQHHAVEIASVGYTAVFGTMAAWLLVSRRPGIIMSTEEVVVLDQRGTRIVWWLQRG